MDKDNKISVIIPVYNTEPYLRECLDTIVSQTYANLEIILVDDGSTDGSGGICDEYAGRDERCKVIHRENGGVAVARNTALGHVSGDLVIFSDSDDWFETDAFEFLYNIYEKSDADCVVGCTKDLAIGENPNIEIKEAAGHPEKISSDDMIKRVLLGASGVGNKLFKREIFEGISFPDVRTNDDEIVIIRAYDKCKKIVMSNRVTYYYRKRENSLTTSRFSLYMLDCYYNSKINLGFVTERRPQLIPCAEYKVVKSLLWCYVNIKKMKKTEEVSEKLRALKNDIKKYRKMGLDNEYLDFKYKALLWLCAL